MNDVINIKIYGNGGGGVVTAAKIIAIALIEGENKNAQMFPTFGPERSGAPVSASIRICERPVPTPIEIPDIIVVFNSALGDKEIFKGLHDKTVVILDTASDATKMSKIYGRPVWCVDASGIAEAEIGKSLPGIALFGTFSKATGLVSQHNMYLAIRENFPKALLKGNLRSAHRGAAEAVYSGDMEIVESEKANAGNKPGWNNMIPGAVTTEAGNSKSYDTGSWGKEIPAIDMEKCKLCMICWAMCPDDSLSVEDGKLFADEAHCKGCGICADVCPENFAAITMTAKKEVKNEN